MFRLKDKLMSAKSGEGNLMRTRKWMERRISISLSCAEKKNVQIASTNDFNRTICGIGLKFH
jgi:hypothetical protein